MHWVVEQSQYRQTCYAQGGAVEWLPFAPGKPGVLCYGPKGLGAGAGARGAHSVPEPTKGSCLACLLV